MRKFLRAIRRRILPPPPRPEENFRSRGFAQEGEDLVLERLLPDGKKTDGFYIDVGAHHPFRFSNTYYFYLKGWRGLNVDAMPGSMRLFHQHRPRDINLEAAISEHPSQLKYYTFDEPALNGFSRAITLDRQRQGTYRLIGEVQIQTQRLDDLLQRHLVATQAIDFLSVDVEGLDLEVLRSNDWSRYRPRFVLTEDIAASTIAEAIKSPVASFLSGQGYVLRSKLVHTMIFEYNYSGAS